MRSLVGEFARKRITKICIPYFQTRITGYRLQVTGYRLQVTGYRYPTSGPGWAYMEGSWFWKTNKASMGFSI